MKLTKANLQALKANTIIDVNDKQFEIVTSNDSVFVANEIKIEDRMMLNWSELEWYFDNATKFTVITEGV